MVGVVVVGHGRLGESMVSALESIVGPVTQFVAVATSDRDPPEEIQRRIRDSVRAVDAGHGVIVCTDMFGDTATNQSVVVARETGAEVVAGVNMPMLFKLTTDRAQHDAHTLAGRLKQYGQDHIYWLTADRGAGAAARS